MKYLSNDMGKVAALTGLLLTVLMANAGVAGANGEAGVQQGFFPVWTYYAEIFEHSVIMITGIAAILLLIRPHRKSRGGKKQGILWMIAGLAILTLSQLLTNLHHFSFFLFGIWNAVIHHGLLAASIIIIVVAYFKMIKGVKE